MEGPRNNSWRGGSAGRAPERFWLCEDQGAAYANYTAVDREIREGRVRLATRPPYVRMDVTSRCNLRCLQCVFTATRASGQDMLPEVLARIESEILPTAAAVQYADEGEPFLFRDFERLASALARHRPAYSRIFTNATLLDERARRRIIECGLADLAVSLDGATEATFARIRRTSLARVVENLSRLRDLKRELRARHPVVTIHGVVMLDNLDELGSIVRLAGRLGAAEVIFYKMFQYTPEMAGQSTDDAVEEARRRLAEAIETGVEIGLPVRLSPTLPSPPIPERERIDDRFYDGALEVEPPTPRVRPGRNAAFRVTVRNRSPFTWYSSRCPSTHSDVAVSYHLYAADGALLDWDGRRTPLPRHLEPGGAASVDVHVAVPDRPGDFVLGFDLVNERKRWFGLEGRVGLAVDETAPRGAPDEIPIEATPTETGRCQHPWKYASVKADGDVFPCRFLSIPMGNLRKQSFGEVWNSERYRRLRATILDDSYAFCRGAPCPFAAAPEGTFRSSIDVLEAPASVSPGGVTRLRLAVRNEGTATWNARPRDGIPTCFMVSCMLYDARRRLQPYAPQRTELPGDVPPGACVELEVAVPAPGAPGRYVLGFEMTRRPVFEFTALGNPVCEVPLRVEAPGRAEAGRARALPVPLGR